MPESSRYTRTHSFSYTIVQESSRQAAEVKIAHGLEHGRPGLNGAGRFAEPEAGAPQQMVVLGRQGLFQVLGSKEGEIIQMSLGFFDKGRAVSVAECLQDRLRELIVRQDASSAIRATCPLLGVALFRRPLPLAFATFLHTGTIRLYEGLGLLRVKSFAFRA